MKALLSYIVLSAMFATNAGAADLTPKLKRDPFQAPTPQREAAKPELPATAVVRVSAVASTARISAASTYAPPSAPDWKLRAVLHAGDQSMININGEMISVGNELHGYRLLEIREREAEFVKQGVKFVVTMDEGKTR